MSTDNEQSAFELDSLPRLSDELRSKEAYIAICLDRVPPEVIKAEIAHVVTPNDKNEQLDVKLDLDRKIHRQNFGFRIEQAKYFTDRIGDNDFYHPKGDIWFASESDNPELFEQGQQARAIIRELIDLVINPLENIANE